MVIGEAGDDVPRWHAIVVSAPMIATSTNLVGDLISGDLTLSAQYNLPARPRMFFVVGHTSHDGRPF